LAKKRRDLFWFGVFAIGGVTLTVFGIPSWLAFKAGWIARSEKDAAGKSLAAAEDSRLHKMASFDLLDYQGGLDGNFLSYVANGVFEEQEYMQPRIDGERLLIEQPHEIAAGQTMQASGLVIQEVHGDFHLLGCLDLDDTRLNARNTTLSWSIDMDWEAASRLEVAFEPARRELNCGGASRPVPKAARNVCVTLTRNGSSVWADVEINGVAKELCRLSGPGRHRPARRSDLIAILGRPPESPLKKPYKAKVFDEYRVSSFEVKCLDPDGCRARLMQ
jgi:hypothetical protein